MMMMMMILELEALLTPFTWKHDLINFNYLRRKGDFRFEIIKSNETGIGIW